MHEDVSGILKNVPPTAHRIVLRYQASSEEARARLHRFQGDAMPVPLHGPNGFVKITLTKPRTLFLERFDKCGWDLKCVGHHGSLSATITEKLALAWRDAVTRGGLGLPLVALCVGISIPSLYWKYVSGPSPDFLAFVYNVTPMLAIVVSIVTLIVGFKHNRFSLGVEILDRLNNEFDGPTMRTSRARAAQSLAHSCTSNSEDVNRVLDFFEHVGLLERRGAVDIELIWHAFYYWFTCYYELTTAYRHEARQEDPTQWEDIERLALRIEMQQQKHAETTTAITSPASVNEAPSDVQLSFLRDEARLKEPERQRRVRRAVR